MPRKITPDAIGVPDPKPVKGVIFEGKFSKTGKLNDGAYCFAFDWAITKVEGCRVRVAGAWQEEMPILIARTDTLELHGTPGATWRLTCNLIPATALELLKWSDRMRSRVVPAPTQDGARATLPLAEMA